MELIQIEVLQINSTTDFYNGQGLENLLLGRKLVMRTAYAESTISRISPFLWMCVALQRSPKVNCVLSLRTSGDYSGAIVCVGRGKASTLPPSR